MSGHGKSKTSGGWFKNPFKGKPLFTGVAVLGALLLVVGIIKIAGYNPLYSWWNKEPQEVSAQKSKPVQTAKHNCNGEGQSLPVGPEWMLLNPGFGCHIIFEVVGQEMELGEPSNFVPAKPGDQIGNVLARRGVRVMYARTTGGRGVVNFMLYPHGCKEHGWECT